jgi:hypothetical protein
MYFNYSDPKQALYLGQTLIGVLIISLSSYWLTLTTDATTNLILALPAAFLILVGLACVFFGAETYFFKEDPEIWRYTR